MSNMYGFENLCSPDDIEHYGVKGQRWGVRKYQNKDGTLTALGKKRYGGEKAQQYKQAEIDIATRRRDKAIFKHNTKKANKYNRQIQALNKMTEKDVINEQLGIVQEASRTGFTWGLIGGLPGVMFASLVEAPVTVAATRDERSQIFAKDYKDMTIEEMKKEIFIKGGNS